MERFYFDYNATSPLSPSVIQWLKGGDLPYANPASAHYLGQKSKNLINETSEYLKNTFNLKEFEIFFHSGASEGVNTIIRGWANLNPNGHFFCSEIDHSSIVNLPDFLKLYGVTTHFFPVDKNGDFDSDELTKQIKNLNGAPCLLNYTFVNNVLGVVWDLKWAEKIKSETNCKIHVDAVQAPGKIKGWGHLNSLLDSYTFSGHKFGSFKGIGFSFFRKDFQFAPLLSGGGQQNGLRSGTENPLGVASLKLALEDLISEFNYENSLAGKSFIESELEKILGTKGEIVAKNAKIRNANTICLVQSLNYPELIRMKFDLAGINVGYGSACSSGTMKPDRVLLSLGYDEEAAKSGIRLSFGPNLDLELAKIYSEKINSVFSKPQK